MKLLQEELTSTENHIAFGHDIEGSWRLCEAAELLGDARKEAVRMAQAVHDDALDPDGGLLHEADGRGIIDSDKHWWPQTEAVVGFLNAYQLSGQEHFRTAALRSWDFIEKCIVDREHGEWFWMVSRAGLSSNDKFKVDPWKCPYGNRAAQHADAATCARKAWQPE